MTEKEIIQKYHEINKSSADKSEGVYYLASLFAALISYCKRAMDEKSFKWVAKWIYEIMSHCDNEQYEIVSAEELYGFSPFEEGRWSLADNRLRDMQENLIRAYNTYGEVKCSLLEYLEFDSLSTIEQEVRHNLSVIDAEKKSIPDL